MSKKGKNREDILRKLGIKALNEMQVAASSAIYENNDVLLLSPTGTGKTIAFLLPVLSQLKDIDQAVQIIIIVPSRELAIQIEQVLRDMGTGYKVNAVYGGRHFSKDKIELKHPPTILIGTPGRLADHLRRETFSTQFIDTLVLDEYDKSLEVGFEDEMSEILEELPNISKKILTSATQGIDIPEFTGVEKPFIVDFLSDAKSSRLIIKKIVSPSKDKLEALYESICHLGDEPGIIFCNYKDSIQRISDFLNDKGIDHGTFYGGMEQKDRERSLIKFRNGSHQLLLATDLAARGIDIQEIKFIIHYHLPFKGEEFTHRNGRTARMKNDGKAFVLIWENDDLPDYLPILDEEYLSVPPSLPSSLWSTLFISGGRKDKVSKGDIAGLFLKQGELDKNQLGLIELKQDCAFVAVPKSKAGQLITKLNNSRIKKRKVRIDYA